MNVSRAEYDAIHGLAKPPVWEGWGVSGVREQTRWGDTKVLLLISAGRYQKERVRWRIAVFSPLLISV